MAQPRIVTTGLVFELHAARWHAGTTHGVNSPLTSTLTGTSGSGYNATLSGTAGTAASGYAGSGVTGDPYALVMDGNDYAALSDLGVSEDKVFSFEAWFKTSVAAIQYLVREAGATSVATLRVGSTGIIRGEVIDDASAVARCDGPACADGLWHHAVMVCDGSYITTYLDGVAATPVAMPGGTLTQTVTRLSNNTTGLQGSLAVARAYSVALSAAEVAQNYAAGYLWPRTFTPGSYLEPSSRYTLKLTDLDLPVL